MTPEVIKFLLEVLSKLQVSAGDPEFDRAVGLIQNARKELSQLADRTDSK